MRYLHKFRYTSFIARTAKKLKTISQNKIVVDLRYMSLQLQSQLASQRNLLSSSVMNPLDFGWKLVGNVLPAPDNVITIISRS